jgi:hypothetical protein
LQQLQALGISSVTVHINFPILYSPSYTDQCQYQQYLNFYIQVASEVRAAGLKLVVESQVAQPNPASQDPTGNPYLPSLTWTEYMAGRAQNAAVVAQYIQPDYLTVIAEPDTEATMSGQSEAGTVSGSTQLLQTILAAVAPVAAANTAVGAGTGTWQQDFTSYLDSFAAQPLQYLDIHIYPVNNGYLPNAITAATIAQQAGLGIGMSEAWLYKILNSELPDDNPDLIYERNNYSFWEPLDPQFLQVISNLANYERFTFISPFWINYFFAYMDYTAANSSSIPAAMQLSITGMDNCLYTSTALAYENAILPAPDTEAPQVPAPPSIVLDGSSVQLQWKATTDNVGVAGYLLYKNNQLLATTPSLSFDDAMPEPGILNVYTLAAFDAAGNISPTSAPVQPPRR